MRQRLQVYYALLLLLPPLSHVLLCTTVHARAYTYRLHLDKYIRTQSSRERGTHISSGLLSPPSFPPTTCIHIKGAVRPRMPARESGFSRVVRAVSHGDGDWADLPPSLRNAVLMTLTQSCRTPLHSVQSSAGDTRYAHETGQARGCAHRASAPPPLTEEVVQSSIETFEEAAWVREEAARSYAEFHNNVESLYATMCTQLRSVWRTAMQLSPDILADVRDEWHLSRRDRIPDGIPLPASATQHLPLQEAILDEVVETLRVLRNTSVRFAAYFLTDEEKISMGVNPAYLRAPDIDTDMVLSHSPSRSTSPQRALPASQTSASLSAGALKSAHIKASSSSVAAVDAPREKHSQRHQGIYAQHEHSRSSDEAGRLRCSSRRHVRSDKSSCASWETGDDPLLDELRRQYQLRIRELKTQSEREGSRQGEHRASQSAAQPPSLRGARARIAATGSSSLLSKSSSASASVLTNSSLEGSHS
ncbi:hypothetical protein, conserved [Leishmania tarentolae]|uniref:Uncharacterized protein n=1 Tax=Leishmania tarentolae TaxID=5689 RepID=A0A640K6U1_LEITA|nr:hypothetical protein, conserved [Leishmania tarentolae]